MIALYRLLVLVGLIGLWWATSFWVGPSIVPNPVATLAAAQHMIASGELATAFTDSLMTYLGGFAAAALFAVPIGLAMGIFAPVGKTLEVYVFALAATPRVAFVPLIIVFLGLGIEAKIVIVFLGAVMPIVINTYAGVLAVDEDLLEMARSVRAGRFDIFRSIVLPGAVPSIIVGLRIGATIGLINTVVAELYTAVNGLGGLLALYGNTFRMAEYFVIVLVLAGMGVVVAQSLHYLERRLVRWKAVT